MKKIVIFDLDGTLVDSKKDITISINYVRKHNHNLPPLSEAFVVEAINKKERNLTMLFYRTPTYEERDREAFENHYYNQCIKNSFLFSGIKGMLETLKQNGVLLCVATNATTIFAKRMLAHLEVGDSFYAIVGADISKAKPQPDMLLKLLHSCRYRNGDHAWMVGDNQKDIEAAKRAGIDAVYATWGFQGDVDWDIRADKPSDILKIVL